MKYSKPVVQNMSVNLSSGRKSMKIASYLILLQAAFAISCGQAAQDLSEAEISAADTTVVTAENASAQNAAEVLPGVYRFFEDISALSGKRIGVVANHTSLIEGNHLVDSLIASGLDVKRIFAPEHGFRGNMADGATVADQQDALTGLPILSLYGKNKKPGAEYLSDLDVVIFDIQDVGARFYTYLSSLHNVMEACAEAGVAVIVLDRPNPNIHYIDGPVLDIRFRSFVGMHPVPVVYGMSIGEYALMINGEGWLAGGVRCTLSVVQCINYTRESRYNLPVPPSPNLPDMRAVYLYPSLCFFEGTNVSVGRGTPHPFMVIGEPGNTGGDFMFTPVSIPGVSDYPPHEKVICRGYDLTDVIDLQAPIDSINVEWLVRMYQETDNKSGFFLKSGFFQKLAGTDQLKDAVVAGIQARGIKETWLDDIEEFKLVRAKYLIYD